MLRAAGILGPVTPDVSPARRPRRRRLLAQALVGLLVLVLMGAGAAALLLGGPPPSEPFAGPAREPAAVPPPEGLGLPEVPEAPPVAVGLPEPADGADAGSAAPPGRIDPRAVRRAVGRLADDRRLGRRVAVAVAGLDGAPVLESGPGRVTPASTMKLLTALAALESLGPEHRFVTRVVRTGNRLTLVGGGDPLLARRPPDPTSVPTRADVVTLARRTARTLLAEDRARVRLTYDDSLFGGPAASPQWEPDYLPDDVVSPVSALWVDQGREAPGLLSRSDDPSSDAAEAFASALRRQGVRVLKTVREARAPGNAVPVAEVHGAELVEVVQHVLELSDNEAAEVLAHQVAVAEGEPATFAGGADAIRTVLGSLGIDLRGAVLDDGSGLARTDRLGTRTLLDVLATAASPERPLLTGLVEGLPVAGFNGSLALRFSVGADQGLGWVRAKTGTLTGVHGLAGVVTARDGAVLTFVAIADRVRIRNALFARDRLDQVAAALAGCRCLAR